MIKLRLNEDTRRNKKKKKRKLKKKECVQEIKGEDEELSS